jgi:O-antigen biosynthesis protein
MKDSEKSVSAEGAAAAAAPAVPGGLDATWLSESLLLAVGHADLSPGDRQATLSAGDDSFEAAVRCMALPLLSSGERRVLTAAVNEDVGAARLADTLTLRSGAEGEGDAVTLTILDLPGLIESRLSSLRPAVARRVLEFVSAAPSLHGLSEARDLVLSSELHILRRALRPPLPAVAIEPSQPLCANIDLLIPIDDSTFFIKGWLRDGEAPVNRLTAITPEGEYVEILERLFRLELPQFEMFADGPYSEPVDAARFIARFETARPSRLRQGWVFEIQNETGRAVEMYALPDVAEVPAARARILRGVPAGALPDEQLMSNHVFPAIERLQERARGEVEIAGVVDHGPVSESPTVSIVVPLYKRIDLVEHQLLQFDRDPEIQVEELIYVLDSPELKTAFADSARQLARLYRMPFRVVTMARNAGFGAATNAGASLARGRLLLLLNSDVLPAEPGWLEKMREFYDSTPDIGALGAKLLYEDDSLQHAGLYFEMIQEGPTAGAWANMHYFKGLHKDLPAASVPRTVPAVTAACLMVEKQLYQSVGGLPDVYVQGDYEDSELCLKLLEAGRENWYLPDAELYHLEGASYEEAERGITGSYNRWLQTRRNGQAIEAALKRYSQV